MKYHKILAILGCALLTVNIAHSATLTVDNNPGSVAMYSSLPAAYEAAVAGDTIILTASALHYDAITVYKRLHFKGGGYLISENNIQNVNNGWSVLYSVRVDKSASLGDGSGTTFSGIFIGYVESGQATGVRADRCRVDGLNGLKSWNFDRCYMGGPNAYLIEGCVFRNSIFNHGVTFLGINSTASNCIFLESVNCTQAANSVSNSIVVSSSITAASFANSFKGSIAYSMAVGDSVLAEGRKSFLPSGGGNLNGFNFTDVFIPNGNNDGKWQLKVGSPAIATGFSGVDMGAFGGASPYLLSGIPPQPRITRLVVPAAATDATGLQFEVDAKAF